MEDRIQWVLRDRQYWLEMEASRPAGGSLLRPDRVELGKRIVETISSTIKFRLSIIAGKEMISGTG